MFAAGGVIGVFFVQRAECGGELAMQLPADLLDFIEGEREQSRVDAVGSACHDRLL